MKMGRIFDQKVNPILKQSRRSQTIPKTLNDKGEKAKFPPTRPPMGTLSQSRTTSAGSNESFIGLRVFIDPPASYRQITGQTWDGCLPSTVSVNQWLDTMC